MSERILEIRNLVVHYETTDGCMQAVNGVDLDIEKGEIVGLVGETGAGKTTTALSILNLIPSPPGRIVSGEILFNGEDILKMSPLDMRALRGEQIAMIFQDPMTALDPVFRVEDQIAEAVRTHDHVSKEQALKVAREKLELVGIPAGRGKEYPHQFSGGMKQRVVIAMALACNPSLILADEPTTALDVTIQAQVLDLMRELQKKIQSSMLLITHDLGVVAEICQSAAIMYAGEIVEYGKVEHIFDETVHPYTKGLFSSLPDLTRQTQRLNPIPGLMPDPADLPTGCKFHPRCPYATSRCTTEHPEITEISPGHLVRCHNCKEAIHNE